jgi:putative oxidoreductase
LIPVTFIFHKFWGIDAAQAQNQMIHFLKNVSIMGGMLLLFAFGPGAYSLDKK